MATTQKPPQAEPTKAVAPQKKGALDFLAPRETHRIAKARGPRLIVDRLRILLPVGAVIVLAALFLWPMINPHKIIINAVKNIPDLVIQNLHFNGLDTKNQPYTLTAATATRAANSTTVYDLDKPQGEITLDSGAWLSGKADYGRFDEQSRKLWLGGDVQLFHDKGYQFSTDEAQVDINGYYAWGEKPVMIQGDFGQIQGTGFQLLDSGSVMIIHGPAKAILSTQHHLQDDGGSDKPAKPPK